MVALQADDTALKSVISYQLSVIRLSGGLVGDALTATNA
jgi:hypothetical protein